MSRLTIVSITIPIIIIAGFFFTWPHYQSVRDLSLQIEAKQTELQTKEEYFSKIKKVSDELKNYETEVSKINSALPSEPFAASVFNFLQNAASQNGLILRQIITFSIADSKTRTGLKEVEAQVTVVGSYEAFKNFLSALEKSARLIEVEDITFFYVGEKETPSFDVTIKAYSF